MFGWALGLYLTISGGGRFSLAEDLRLGGQPDHPGWDPITLGFRWNLNDLCGAEEVIGSTPSENMAGFRPRHDSPGELFRILPQCYPAIPMWISRTFHEEATNKLRRI